MTSDSDYRKVEKELLFFFNHSDAAIGFKSSHASFVAAVYGVSATVVDTDPYTDGLLRQVKKIRKIRNIFFSLPKETRRTLEAIYNLENHHRYPIELVNIYGHKTGAVFFNQTVTELNKLIQLCKKKKQSKLTEVEQVIMFNVGEDTRKIWERTHEEYLEAKQRFEGQK